MSFLHIKLVSIYAILGLSQLSKGLAAYPCNNLEDGSASQEACYSSMRSFTSSMVHSQRSAAPAPPSHEAAQIHPTASAHAEYSSSFLTSAVTTTTGATLTAPAVPTADDNAEVIVHDLVARGHGHGGGGHGGVGAIVTGLKSLLGHQGSSKATKATQSSKPTTSGGGLIGNIVSRLGGSKSTTAAAAGGAAGSSPTKPSAAGAAGARSTHCNAQCEISKVLHRHHSKSSSGAAGNAGAAISTKCNWWCSYKKHRSSESAARASSSAAAANGRNNGGPASNAAWTTSSYMPLNTGSGSTTSRSGFLGAAGQAAGQAAAGFGAAGGAMAGGAVGGGGLGGTGFGAALQNTGGNNKAQTHTGYGGASASGSLQARAVEYGNSTERTVQYRNAPWKRASASTSIGTAISETSASGTVSGGPTTSIPYSNGQQPNGGAWIVPDFPSNLGGDYGTGLSKQLGLVPSTAATGNHGGDDKAYPASTGANGANPSGMKYVRANEYGNRSERAVEYRKAVWKRATAGAGTGDAIGTGTAVSGTAFASGSVYGLANRAYDNGTAGVEYSVPFQAYWQKQTTLKPFTLTKIVSDGEQVKVKGRMETGTTPGTQSSTTVVTLTTLVTLGRAG